MKSNKMTPKEARAQIEDLLATQYRLIAVAGVERGARQTADDTARYVANGIEILRLGKIANLSPVSLTKPANATVFPVHQPVAWNPQAIREAKERLDEIAYRAEGGWMDKHSALVREIELAERMSRP